jgi:hypothetical protein
MQSIKPIIIIVEEISWKRYPLKTILQFSEMKSFLNFKTILAM